MARDVLVDVFEAKKDEYKDVDMHLRMSAAYAIRFFAERRSIEALLRVVALDTSSETAPVSDKLPEPIHGMTLSEIARDSLEALLSTTLEHTRADVFYTDKLKGNIAKLENIIVHTDKLVYLVDRQGRPLHDLLRDIGLDKYKSALRDSGRVVLIDATEMSTPDIKTSVVISLHGKGIALKDVSVYAAKKDIEAWRDSILRELYEIMDGNEYKVVSVLQDHINNIRAQQQVATQA
jgi:hypothetical protein